jgi:hypothetical protein
LNELFGVSGNKRIKDIAYERRDKLISQDFFLLKKLFRLSQDQAVGPVQAKGESGFYFKNNINSITPELPQTSAKERTPQAERQLKTIAAKYAEYWENCFFISHASLPSPQEFRATFPEYIQNSDLKIKKPTHQLKASFGNL